jgi:hypothetical protein
VLDLLARHPPRRQLSGKHRHSPGRRPRHPISLSPKHRAFRQRSEKSCRWPTAATNRSFRFGCRPSRQRARCATNWRPVSGSTYFPTGRKRSGRWRESCANRRPFRRRLGGIELQQTRRRLPLRARRLVLRPSGCRYLRRVPGPRASRSSRKLARTLRQSRRCWRARSVPLPRFTSRRQQPKRERQRISANVLPPTSARQPIARHS